MKWRPSWIYYAWTWILTFSKIKCSRLLTWKWRWAQFSRRGEAKSVFHSKVNLATVSGSLVVEWGKIWSLQAILNSFLPITFLFFLFIIIIIVFTVWDLTGSHALSFSSLRVMAFVAVKERAFNFLSSLLNSPVAWQVLQHCRNKLLSFVEHLRSSNSQSDEVTSVLDLCER